MGGCRWRFWSTLTVLALLWTCGGPILTVAQYISHTPRLGSSARIFYAVVDFLWIGLTVTSGCAFFGYRSSRHWRNQRRDKELQIVRESKGEKHDWPANARMRQGKQEATADSFALSPEIAAKLETARVLIDNKNYDAARAILKTIDHPEATQCLEQIDLLSPWHPSAVENRDGDLQRRIW
jgi:hypothetical protein